MSLEITSINGMGSITISGSTVTTTGMKADDHMHIADDFIISQGILEPDHFLVEEMATPGLGIKVAIGVAYILNPNWTDSSNVHQKFYRVKMDAELAEVAINANTAGNPRITSIFIKIDTSALPGADGEDAVSIIAIDGTAAASPTAPATPVDGNAYIRLADVECADSFVSILDASITDQRVITQLRALDNGWNESPRSFTFASVDDPTGVITCTDADDFLSVGMRIKFTNATNTIYGIVTAVTSTTFTFLHQMATTGTGAAVNLMANSAITNPSYSTQKAPFGFPTSPLSWEKRTVYTGDTSDTSGTQTYLNVGAVSLVVPIGVWNLSYTAMAFVARASTGNAQVYTTLGLTNTSEVANFTRWSVGQASTNPNSVFINSSKDLEVNITTKATYYLNIKSGVSNTTSVTLRGAEDPCIIKATCAYL